MEKVQGSMEIIEFWYTCLVYEAEYCLQNAELAFFLFISVQLLSHVRLFVTPWIVARQASLSITNSRSLLKVMSIE